MKKTALIIGLVLLASLVSVYADNPIQKGIEESSLEDAVVYSNQKVIIRDMNNNQATVTFDKFVVKGNQRWGFNYIEKTGNLLSKLFNLANVFFAADFGNSTTVTKDVRDLIDNTKN